MARDLRPGIARHWASACSNKLPLTQLLVAVGGVVLVVWQLYETRAQYRDLNAHSARTELSIALRDARVLVEADGEEALSVAVQHPFILVLSLKQLHAASGLTHTQWNAIKADFCRFVKNAAGVQTYWDNQVKNNNWDKGLKDEVMASC